MKNTGRRGASRTYRVAVGGILSAFALAALLAGGAVSVGEFAAPIAAGLFLVPVALDMGARWALLCYAAVGILGFILVPGIELVLYFTVFFGYYPVLRPQLQRIKFAGLRWAAKLGLFNLAVAAVYALLASLFAVAETQRQLAEMAPLFIAAALLAANATFVLYDIAIHWLLIVYETRVRRYIFR